MRSIPRLNEERVYDGLRIPSELDTLQSVNFVLTQEPGKLKPKDLKLAIERNRAEKKLRAEEQKKIRDESGGAGTLDLRGILAEERMNSVESDPFKRHLREMAFLADVDDVEKQEIEKSYRISECFLGSYILSPGDISDIYHQRSVALLHKKRTEWRSVQSRQRTLFFAPSHQYVKGGASAETAVHAIRNINPSFDPNGNDIWGKRINTLRRFIAIVSLWLNQRRVSRRLSKVMDMFLVNGASTREEVRAYIEAESETNKKQGGGVKPSASSVPEVKFDPDALNDALTNTKPPSLSVMLLDTPSEVLSNREHNEFIIGSANAKSAEETISFDMVRRVLFPKTASESGAGQAKQEIPPVTMDRPICFEDRTIFQLKVTPHFITLDITPQELPPVPILFPPCHHTLLRTGAAEEVSLRPAADQEATLQDIVDMFVPPSDEPKFIRKLRSEGSSQRITETAAFFQLHTPENRREAVIDPTAKPLWMTAEAAWSQRDLNLFNATSDARNYISVPRRCEVDCDWVTRPNTETLTYVMDTSMRSKWSTKPGFQSANTYLLRSLDARNKDLPLAPGPTLVDLYSSDSGRHASGMFCYCHDHVRGAIDKDPDVAPLQQKQSKSDYLTDSESDNDDEYGIIRPTITRVRRILKPGSGDEVNAGMYSGTESGDESAPLLSESQKKEEQVELIRDRKVLDWQSTITKARKNKFDSFNERIVNLSRSSKCPLLAIPVQLPFHRYEDTVYQLVGGRTQEMSTTHVELNPRMSAASLPVSPTKTPKKSPLF